MADVQNLNLNGKEYIFPSWIMIAEELSWMGRVYHKKETTSFPSLGTAHTSEFN